MELIQIHPPAAPRALKIEIAGIVVAILIFLLFPYGVRLLDVTAAPIDAGIYSAIVLAVSALLIFKAVTWWLIRSIWPVFAHYSVNHFENNFKSLEPCQKVIIYLVFYCVLLLAFILVLLAIL